MWRSVTEKFSVSVSSFVDPTAWKQGIGESLIRKAELLAASEGAEWLYVVVNPKTLGFYESCAFEPIGEVETQFGSGLMMRKNLHAGLLVAYWR